MHAPYNFIEFADTVIERYSDVDELPKHNCTATDLKTGEIHYTFTAKTPVFVGGETEAPHAGQKEGIKTQHFYKNIAGNYEIPGSTVRGLIRENVHILGYGLIRDGEDIEDERFFLRDVREAIEQLLKNIRKCLEQYMTGTVRCLFRAMSRLDISNVRMVNTISLILRVDITD